MTTTVLEALQNAQHNLETIGNIVSMSHMGSSVVTMLIITRSQLANAIEALENGQLANDQLIEPPTE